ncbi:hypothetical protein Golob_023359 [Gossypium lobatum]|uniref:Uncharacterized protein n=1 Tax=Gossypium lobatum TaxID=34289 RepID=A0A7J8LJH3_9ROSI|nr:hypothetical protein [Gossypium lobatum]
MVTVRSCLLQNRLSPCFPTLLSCSHQPTTAPKLSPNLLSEISVKLDSSWPLTNRKHWVVTEILKKARIYTPPSVDTAANASAKNEAPLSSTSQGSV